jgi:hypothetical protein
MAEPFGTNGASTAPAISAGQVNHLAVVAYFARRLGLVQIVNRLVSTQMEVEPGMIVLGLVLDTLSGRSPLYHLETAFEDCDRALLFARELPTRALKTGRFDLSRGRFGDLYPNLRIPFAKRLLQLIVEHPGSGPMPFS